MSKKNSLLFLFVGLIVGLGIALKFDIMPNTKAANPGVGGSASSKHYESRFDLEKATMDVAQRVGVAVVSISSVKVEKVGGRRYYFGSPFGGSPFEDEFFDKFFEDFFGGTPQREFKQRGLGSGVIIDPQGYILTNEHVVGGADKLTVKLSDGREFEAEIKGVDPRSDLAIIKIDADKLPVAGLGDSDDVKIGQWVVAVGNPFGFALENPEPTVTVGVVSALRRTLGRVASGDRDYSDLIQTDAAINPGNSGGPLVNLDGQIIGINVAIFSTSGGYQGIGFAIPINSAKRVLDQLIEGKRVLYGWLGVNIQDIDENLANYFKLKNQEGVMVVKVLEDTPAKKSGIKEGDIIVSYNRKKITDVRNLVKRVGETQVGKRVPVEVLRDGKKVTLQVQIGERPDPFAEEIESKEKVATEEWRGLSVESIDSAIAKRYGIEEEYGVVVIEIKPNSIADQSGLMVGDVIMSMNRRQIKNLKDYSSAVKSIKGDALIRTNRGYFVIKAK